MITRKVLLMEQENTVRMYELENEEIVEIHVESCEDENESKHVLGNIYVGRVKNIVPNIGAAFIEIEPGVECYYDISQAKNAYFTNKIGKKPICIGDELIVQISKEAVKTKSPTVSSNLSFQGRYAVLTSGNTRIGTSTKLSKSEREEWKEELKNFKNDDYGIVIRTNAKSASKEDVLEEINELKDEYDDLCTKAMTRKVFSCLKKAPAAYLTELRNVYRDGLEEIIIEGHKLYDSVYKFLKREQPDDLEKLRLYNNKKLALSKVYGTDTALRRALSEKVWLKDGAYLIIQYTEALTVIDVNSGKCVSKKDPFETYKKINLNAAKEVAKQLRLRNLSGIVIVDFINLDDEEAFKELLKSFRIFLSKDPIQSTLVDVTALQLVEVTRKKVRKPLHEKGLAFIED